MKILFIGARLFDDVSDYLKRENIHTILTESNKNAPNTELADEVFIVPRGMSEPEKIAIKEKVDAVIPLIGIDAPLKQVAILKENLKQENIPVISSPLKAVELAQDKTLTKKFFQKNNILTPQFKIILNPENKTPESIKGNMNFPLVLKQPEGQAGRTVEIVNTLNEIQEYINIIRTDKLLVEQFIQGDEISIEVLCWNNTYTPLVPVFKGKTTIEGIHPLYKTKKAPYTKNKQLYGKIQIIAEKIAEKMGCEGTIDIDLIYDEKEVYAIEVNTRPSGTRYLTTASSHINPLHQLINMATGKYNPETLIKKEYVGEEIPIGTFTGERIINPDTNKPLKEFLDENTWVVHGPENYERITISATNEKNLEKIIKKLNII